MATPVFPSNIEETTNHLESSSINGKNEANNPKDMSIESLLAWDGDLKVKKSIFFKKGGNEVEVIVRGLTQDEIEEIQEKSMRYSGTGLNRISEPDNSAINKRTIYKGVISPDLNDERLQRKFNPGDRNNILIISKLFSPGEQGKIVQAILECSGFTDEQINAQFSDLVNLSEKE